jgi:hypothetical protein
VNEMETGIKESELDRKSLEMLGEYDVVIARTGVFVTFKSQSLSLSEREYKALFEFGQDNKIFLPNAFVVILDNSYNVTVFYPNKDHTEGKAEETEEEEKQERVKMGNEETKFDSDSVILKKITSIVEKWDRRRVTGTELSTLYAIYMILKENGIL